MNVTYRNLNLEFLSSLTHHPNHGRGFKRGLITFRLFGQEYKFNHKDFPNLLGFQSGLDVVSELPTGDFMQEEIDTFWSDIIGRGILDPSIQLSNCIHNPTFRYFQMILAQTFFGRSETDELVSTEEIFFLFCITQSRPIESGTFLIENLELTSKSTEGPIHVEEQ